MRAAAAVPEMVVAVLAVTSGSGCSGRGGGGGVGRAAPSLGSSSIRPRVHRKSGGLSCCAAVLCTHSANCAADRRNSPGAVLGLVLDMPVVWASTGTWPTSLRQDLSRCDGGGASIQFIDKVVASLWTEPGTLGQTVEIPQVQFLDSVFGDCGYWHIDKAVGVPVISRLATAPHLY